MPSRGIHDLVSGNVLCFSVVTCWRTLSEMTEGMGVHFSVHIPLIYCHFSGTEFFFVIL